MVEDTDADDVEYLTDDYEIESELPFRLDDGHGVNIEVPVYSAYNDESTLGPKPAKSSGEVFWVRVNVQRNEAGDETTWGLWNPHDDDEYLGHGVSASGVGYSNFDQRKASVRIEEWLNELLEENMERVEPYITGDSR